MQHFLKIMNLKNKYCININSKSFSNNKHTNKNEIMTNYSHINKLKDIHENSIPMSFLNRKPDNNLNKTNIFLQGINISFNSNHSRNKHIFNTKNISTSPNNNYFNTFLANKNVSLNRKPKKNKVPYLVLNNNYSNINNNYLTINYNNNYSNNNNIKENLNEKVEKSDSTNNLLDDKNNKTSDAKTLIKNNSCLNYNNKEIKKENSRHSNDKHKANVNNSSIPSTKVHKEIEQINKYTYNKSESQNKINHTQKRKNIIQLKQYLTNNNLKNLRLNSKNYIRTCLKMELTNRLKNIKYYFPKNKNKKSVDNKIKHHYGNEHNLKSKKRIKNYNKIIKIPFNISNQTSINKNARNSIFNFYSKRNNLKNKNIIISEFSRISDNNLSSDEHNKNLLKKNKYMTYRNIYFKSKPKSVYKNSKTNKNNSHTLILVNKLNISVNKTKNKKNIQKNKISKSISITKYYKKTQKKQKEKISENSLINKNKIEYTNPQLLEEYIDDIFVNLLIEEKKCYDSKIIDCYYLMNKKNKITPEMRTMVIDWMLEVHQIFNFKEKSLFIAVQLLDRFLSKNKIKLADFQIIAISCINIASKHEEVEYPILDNYITVSGDCFSAEELISAEYRILKGINFEILNPNIFEFFQIFCQIYQVNCVEMSQGFYLLNIILLDVNMLKYKWSVLAFAVMKIISKKSDEIIFNWLLKIKKERIDDKSETEIVENFSAEIKNNEKIEELVEKIRMLFRTVMKTHYINAQNKFASQKFYGISSYSVI